MYKIVIQNEAKDDVRQARKWYNQQQNGLGRRFSADLKNTLLSISANPLAFAVRYSVHSKANLKIFPYDVFFFIDAMDNTAYVVSVMHNSRDNIDLLV
ncbi:MAG: type II toxin-antitoxin system RelE/ParE family toxin [Taibaiella sp.]|nr:type II toxin-antitoxin system RelE/ParE family toxin [Taibaiella sp.]